MARVIVIAGLAQGMGREVAKLMAARGWSIAGFDVDSVGVASLEKELAARESDYLLATVDISDRKAVLEFRDRALDRFGHVDTVLSNVGVAFFGPFEEADLDKALRCLEINVIGMAAVFQAFLPTMRARREGKLVAMSSLVGQVPFPFESIYSASKFAVEGLVLSMRYEVEPFGIKVALIQPAQVSTGFAAKVHKLPPEGSSYRERVRRFIERDEQLIESATTPSQAAEKIIAVLEADNPPVRSQVDLMSTVFLWLNRLLPLRLRDAILLRHMGIRE